MDYVTDSEDASFKAYIDRFWAGRWIALSLSGLTVIVVAIAMHFMTPRYTATMIVAPLSSNSGKMSSILQNPELQNLAGAVGLGSFGDSSGSFDRFIQLLNSTDLAARIATDPTIMHHIFHKQWDEKHKRWRDPNSFISWLSTIYRTFFNLPAWHPPTAQELSEYFGKHLHVSIVPRTHFRQIEFTDRNPVFAKMILMRVYNDGENILRHRAAETAHKQIAYLEKRLASTSMNADNRRALIALEVGAERTRMLSESNVSFSAEIVDQAHVPWLPSSPKPILFSLLAAIFGFGLGVVLTFVIEPEMLQKMPQQLWHRVRLHAHSGIRHYRDKKQRLGG